MNADDINQTFDLFSLAEADTRLKRSGAYYTGPCPMPGCQADHDGFVLKRTNEGWRWYCRKCGDSKYHTSIDYIMKRDNLDFKAALAYLGGDLFRPLARPIKKLPRPIEIRFNTPEWQAEAWMDQTRAITRLLHSRSEAAGRQYLEGRGLVLATWEFASLGFANVYDHQTEIKRPAITIPHFDQSEAITGIKIRFIDELARLNPDRRYSARGRSKFYLYGLYGLNSAAGDLLLMEGEINALSVMQCHPAGFNVLSIGSDNFTEAQAALLRPLAALHKRVTIWTDDPAKSEPIKAALSHLEAQRLQSPMIEGKKYDANQLLQAGLLADFLSTVLNVECLGIKPTKAG
jgi:hypothetical protein